VLDESFFEPTLAGLAERLVAEVVAVTPPSGPGDPVPPARPELGPDPTLALAPLVTAPAAGELRLLGPVGYSCRSLRS
jgi:hypothetical protein